MSKIIAFFIGTLSLLGHVFFPVSQTPVNQNVNQQLSATNTVAIIDVATTTYKTSLNQQTFNNLPITSIEQHTATNSWATAIVFPQSHRYPGSDITDPVNDDAMVVQNQIYSIISRLYNQNHINFVMAEGDLNGPVPIEKISYINQEIILKKQLADESSNLKKLLPASGANQAYLTNFYNQIDKITSYLERDITLAGAPYQFMAEGNNLVLYGAENASTREASANIVRDYVYLNDRLSQLGGGTQLTSAPTNSGTSVNASIMSLISSLGAQQKSQTLESYFPSLGTIAGTNTTLINAINQIKDTYHKIQGLNQTQNTAVSSATPSRSNNPYSSISDVKQIQTLLNKNNTKMTDVVLNQRSTDAADNFAQALKTQNLNTGIIVFGAEHTAGLIKDLNAKGISVISISVQGL